MAQAYLTDDTNYSDKVMHAVSYMRRAGYHDCKFVMRASQHYADDGYDYMYHYDVVDGYLLIDARTRSKLQTSYRMSKMRSARAHNASLGRPTKISRTITTMANATDATEAEMLRDWLLHQCTSIDAAREYIAEHGGTIMADSALTGMQVIVFGDTSLALYSVTDKGGYATPYQCS